jgi:hypothetical protein
MNIHEYQAKALLRTYGAPVSDGRVVFRAEEAKTAAGEMDGPLWVVKAQIHAGGRGKGKFKEADAGEKGGVRLAKSVEEAAEEAKKMLGRTLVTHQTGPAGKQVNRIYIEDGSGIRNRALPRPAGGSPDQPHLFRLLHRRWHGYRGSGRAYARKNPVVQRRSGLGLSGFPRSPHRLFAGPGRRADQAVRQPDGYSLQSISSKKTWRCWRSTP